MQKLAHPFDRNANRIHQYLEKESVKIILTEVGKSGTTKFKAIYNYMSSSLITNTEQGEREEASIEHGAQRTQS